MRKENSTFNTKFISESGSYLINADYFAYVELKDYACYCMADGIDNDQRMESAKIAVTEVLTAFTESPGCSSSKCAKLLELAHRALLQESREIRLEASMVILLTDYKKACWGHAGNARLMLLRNGNIKKKTKDTSLSQKLADDEEIPIDQVMSHEERHNLYTYLGQAGRFKPVVSGKKKLEDGDIICLYTRGIWECLSDAEILDTIEGASTPEIVCSNMEDVILSHQGELLENYSVASIFVDKVYKNPKAGQLKKIAKIVAALLLVVLTICITVGVMRYTSNKKNATQMMLLTERGIKALNDVKYTTADEQFDAAVGLADEVKARKNSDTAKNKAKVYIYNDLASYLADAEKALNEGEFKKAGNRYQEAIEAAEQLKEEFDEDVNFIDTIKVYKQYAEGIKNGMASLEAGDFESAVENFGQASKAVDSIDDTTKRNVSDEYLNTANGNKAMSEGTKFEEEGQALLSQKLYAQALTQYQTALAMYQLAKDTYNVALAESKISMVNIKIDNINQNIDKQSVQEMEAEADSYVQKGNQAQHSGDYKAAAEFFAQAKEIYNKTGNISQVMSVSSKMEDAEYGPDEQNALFNVLEAMKKITSGDYKGALDKLEKAKAAYTKLGDVTSATEITTTISDIKQIINSMGVAPN